MPIWHSTQIFSVSLLQFDPAAISSPLPDKKIRMKSAFEGEKTAYVYALKPLDDLFLKK